MDEIHLFYNFKVVENNNKARLGACSKVYVRPGGARARDSDGVSGGSHSDVRVLEACVRKYIELC
jgi:hypothetical protein